MTESEWAASVNPGEMIRFLCSERGESRRASGRRKLRLFGCACIRRVWHKLRDEGDHAVVAAAEGWADGEVTPEQADEVLRRVSPLGQFGYLAAVRGAMKLLLREPRKASEAWWDAGSAAGSHGRDYAERFRAESAQQAALLRDIFGDPFRPAALGRCVTPTARDLALAAYEQRQLPAGLLDPARLAVLADALEDGGCDDASLLGHLRGPGPHVRGCHAVDLCLSTP
jgi:hypothetical protein